MIRRDYLERLIAQAAAAIAEALRLAREGHHSPALLLLRRTSAELLGPLGPLLDRLSAESAVQLAGRYGLDRIRVYAALIGEEAAVHAAAGEAEDAARRARRALELYAAGSLAGLTLLPADRERIRALVETAGLGQLEARFAAELGRLLA